MNDPRRKCDRCGIDIGSYDGKPMLGLYTHSQTCPAGGPSDDVYHYIDLCPTCLLAFFRAVTRHQKLDRTGTLYLIWKEMKKQHG